MPPKYPEPQITLSLKQEFAYQILAGNKEWESRVLLGAGRLKQLKAGDLVSFHWFTRARVTAVVEEVKTFTTLREMLTKIPPHKFLPSGNFTIQDACEAL